MILLEAQGELSPDAAEEASALERMPFVEPGHSREQVNRAGKLIVDTWTDDGSAWGSDEWDAYYESLTIVNNWRSAHGYPLNTFQTTLRINARRFDHEALVAQRMKRLVSIVAKLEREKSMKLSQMQDLGGCRAVLRSVREAKALADYYLNESRIMHERASMHDYIAEPKDTGYRSIHLIYRYTAGPTGRSAYNGLKIEMQLRSRYQHAWATAVETVGALEQQALKASQGHQDWLRFFELMGTAIAMRENQPLVPNTPVNRGDLRVELDAYASKLNVANRLRNYATAVRRVRSDTKEAKYYLLQLDSRWGGRVSVTGFTADEIEKAEAAYTEAERTSREHVGVVDAVLVSVESLAALERAYPNYFADARVFLQLMNQALTGRSRGVAVRHPLKIEVSEAADVSEGSASVSPGAASPARSS